MKHSLTPLQKKSAALPALKVDGSIVSSGWLRFSIFSSGNTCKILALLWLCCFFATPVISQETDDCLESRAVNLSHKPEAIWISPEISSGPGCCGITEDHFNSFEIIISLHPDARAFEIEFENESGELYYMENCDGKSRSVPQNKKLRICVEPESEPARILFFRPGNTTFKLTIKSLLSAVDIEFPSFDDICMNAAPIELSNASPMGGQYFINGSDEPSTVFDPSLYESGEHTIFYRYTDTQTGCTGMAEETITVLPLPDLSCENLNTTLCQLSEPIILADYFNQLPADGIFRLGGYVRATFNPSTVGSYHFIYEHENSVTHCSNTCNFTITVAGLPQTQNASIPLCDDDESGQVDNVNLTIYGSLITSESDVTFYFFHDESLSIPVANANNVSITNNQIIYVKVENAAGCSKNARLTFTLQDLSVPDKTISLCDESNGSNEVYDLNLQGFNNQVYPTLPGVSYVWYFDENLSQPVTSKVPVVAPNSQFWVAVTQGSCTEVARVDVIINLLPVVSCPGSELSFCKNGGDVNLNTLGVSPAGGIFEGNGVIAGGVFRPSMVAAGVHPIHYTYTQSVTQCINSCTFTVRVYNIPTLISPSQTIEFCDPSGQKNVNLNDYTNEISQDSDVTFSFFLDVNLSIPATPATNFLVEDGRSVYVKVSNSNCSTIASIIFSISTGLDLVDIEKAFCDETDNNGKKIFDVDLNGFNHHFYPVSADAEFEWFCDAGYQHLATANIPEISDEDEYFLRVKVDGCTDEASLTFQVIEYPELTCGDTERTLCQANMNVNLAQELSPSPSGGTFLVKGKVATTLNTSTTGTYEIIYVYSDGSGKCTSTCTYSVKVLPRPTTKSLNILLCHESGSMAVDLREYNSQINSDTTMTFEYYSEFTLNIHIPDPSNFMASHESQAFVNVISENGCSKGTAIKFTFDTRTIEDKTLEICDVSDDQSLQAYNVKLSDFNAQVYTSEPGLTFKWYSHPSLEDEFEVVTVDTINDLDTYYFVVFFSGCRFSAMVTFSILPQPVVSCNDVWVCDYDSTLLLAPLASPPGGVFSGDWITGNTFNIQKAGQGVHALTYTITWPNGCKAKCESTINVFHQEDLICPEDITLCLNAGLTELTGASPLGGVYSGKGITQSDGRFYFNPLVAGADVHTITYNSSQHGCTHSCTFKINVTELPQVKSPDDLILCEGAEDVVLNDLIHSPIGGVFSGTNVSFSNGDYIFRASLANNGSYTIQYDYTDPESNCQNSCSFNMLIIKRPVIVWKDDLSFCSNEGMVELELASPAGGMYSGDYIVDEKWMDFPFAGAGLHPVSYTFTDANGCSTISNRSVLVHESPVANAGTDLFLANCDAVQLNGSVSRGTSPYTYSWSPSAIIDNSLISNPKTLHLGSNTNFRFTVTDANGCRDIGPMTVWVENGKSIQLPEYGPLCKNNPPLELTDANPAGGSYYINENSFSSVEFNPSLAGVGDHFLYYILADSNGCYATAESIVTVNPLPIINWAGEAFCTFSGLQDIELARPTGGSYSGNYVFENQFNTTLSGAGIFPVTYTFVDSLGCSSTHISDVTINELPKVTAGMDQTIYLGSYTTLAAVIEETGDFSFLWEPPVFLVSPQQQVTFSRELLYSQVFKLHTTDKQTTCVNNDEMVVYVEGGELGFVYLIAKPAEICFGDSTRLETLVSGGKPPYKHYWYDEDPRLNAGAAHLNADINNRIFTLAPSMTKYYFLKVVDGEGNEIFRSIRIRVNQLPVIDFQFPEPICYNTTINLPDYVNPLGGEYFIVDGQHIQPPFDPYPMINTATLGVGFHSFLYQYTDQHGCVNTATDTMEVVNVYPVGFTLDSYTGCSPAEVNFTPTSSATNNLSYQWDFDNGQFSQDENPSMSFLNDNNESEVFNIQLTVTDESSGCTGMATSSLLVYPKPKAIINTQPALSESNKLTGCAPFTVRFSSGESLHAQHFQWDFGDGASSSSEHDVTHTFRNAGTYEVTLLASSQGLCQDITTLTIVVANGPSTDFSTDVGSGCSPLDISIQYGFVPDDALQYSWDFSGDGVFTAPDSGNLPLTLLLSHSENEPQTIPIQLRAISPEGCITETARNILVFPKVEAVIEVSENDIILQEDPEGCSPLNLELSAGQSISTTSYAWDFGDGSGSMLAKNKHTFFNLSEDAAAQYTIQLRAESSYGCTASDQTEVKVHKGILASFEPDNSQGCSPHSIHFENLSIAADGYFWDFGDGNKSEAHDPVHLYKTANPNQPQNFVVTLEVTNDKNCRDTFSRDITIYPTLIAWFDVNETVGCGTLDVEITHTGTKPAEGLTFGWNYGDGQQSFTSELVHSHTFINSSTDIDTTFTMSLTVSYMGVCVDVFEKEITVSARPKALFTLEESFGCSPFEISIHNLSSGAETSIWNFGDETEITSADTIIHHIFYNTSTEPRVFNLTLEAIGTNDCSNRMEKNITVLPQPTIEFTTESNSGCHPFTPILENNSTGASRFQWTFGDETTSDQRNPEHVFLNPSGSSVKKQLLQLRGWSDYGCKAIFTDTITILPSPTAEFTSAEQSGCAPFNPGIENTSMFAQHYSWNLGDETTSEAEQPEIILQNITEEPLIRQLSLIAMNSFGCNSITTKTFTVYPQVLAEYSTSDGLLEGCSPLVISFQNASTGGNAFAWDFGNGSNSENINPVQAFINEDAESATFIVKLQATSRYGCIDSVSKHVTILPSAVASFSLDPAKQTYPNTTITITNHHPDQTGSYQWEFGDGTTSVARAQQFTHTYSIDENDLSTKEYWVRLEVSNVYCQAIDQQKAVILSTTPIADFVGDLKGCAPFEASFQNQSLLARTYTWHFGDGSVSFDENPTYTYPEPGKYELMLIANGDGGRDTIREIIEVLATPKADFLIESRLLMASVNELIINNTSKSASFYLWEFGDGGTSVEFEPAYQFELPGLYDISLTVFTNSNPQCDDTKFMEKSIRVEEACMVVFPNAFMPNIAGPSDGRYTPGGNTNQVFYPVHNGLETYQLEIFNRWGEMIYRSNDPLIGWDGYIRGKLSELGVYVWKVTATCKNGKVINTAGDVTLVR